MRTTSWLALAMFLAMVCTGASFRPMYAADPVMDMAYMPRRAFYDWRHQLNRKSDTPGQEALSAFVEKSTAQAFSKMANGVEGASSYFPGRK